MYQAGFERQLKAGSEVGKPIQSLWNLDELLHGFCLMMVLQLLWVIFAVPETKGISLEEMQSRLGITEN